MTLLLVGGIIYSIPNLADIMAQIQAKRNRENDESQNCLQNLPKVVNSTLHSLGNPKNQTSQIMFYNPSSD